MNDTRKYPFVRQTNSNDCAVASLAMIIKYYHGFVCNKSLEELTKTSKNGTTAYNLIEGAKKIGFDSIGIKTNLNDLDKVILPCVAHVTINKTYNHFIVIYEINFKGKFLVVGDPATKIRKIKFAEFNDIWNGVIITFIPTKQIPIINKEMTIKTFIYKLLYSYKKTFLKILFLSLVITMFSILSSFSFKLMIDNIIDSQPKSLLYVIFIIFLIICILKILFNYLRSKLLIFVSQKIDWFLTNDVFKKIIYLPYHYYRNHTTGDIVSRIGDLRTIKEVTSKVVLTLFVDVPLTLFSSISLYFINKNLFLISILVFLLYFLIILIFKPIYKNLIAKIHDKNANVNSYMVESIGAFETIKGLGIDKESIEKFENNYFDLCSSSLKLEKVYNLQSTFKSLIDEIGTLLILFIGSILVLKSEFTLGTLVAFNSLLGYFTMPIKNIVDIDSSLKEASNSISRILEILIKDKESGKLYHKDLNNITYKKLNFSYDDYNLILSNVNLNIKYKEKILIVGDSGSGKSTLLKLLMKFYKIKRGCLFFDNIDINDYSAKCIKDNICYISQNEMLFTDTLYNNLKLNRDVSDEELDKVLDICYIKDIFKNSNLGINTLIEENGFNLSGGERQRIILGRSLLRSFNILIIDEGLNQVDISLERKILKKLLDKYNDKTIIVISHRLDNMDLFDRLIKFKNKKIEEDLIRNG